MKMLEGGYGHFSDDGKEYVITNWRTPKPWINVISNGTWGLTISQGGGGYSWLTHAMLNRMTRWNQDLIGDNGGKFLFLRDNDTRTTWSATPMPMKPEFDEFTCTHGLGYTRFRARAMDILSELTVFVPLDSSCEIWKLEIRNLSGSTRNLSVFSYLELLMGVFPDWHREFHKTFIRTRYDRALNAVIAEKTLWSAPFQGDGGWNKPWPHDLFFLSNLEPSSYECDRERFVGQYNTLSEATAFGRDSLSNRTGTGFDPIIGYHFDLTLRAGESESLVFCLGADTGANHENLVEKSIYSAPRGIEYYRDATRNADRLLDEVKAHWSELCGRLKVDTPDPALNVMVNYWLKYQAISCRLLGRSAYYQCGGAYGFRDQLQDSLIYLSLNPEGTKNQIIMHAGHQKSDGAVQHWWHPVSEEGLFTNMSDDLLWLPFAVFKYLDETGDYSVLNIEVPFHDQGEATIFTHCARAVELALQRRSGRGLSLMGEGDWNDGMNGVGVKWKGESIWLSEFLFGILNEFAKVCRKCATLFKDDGLSESAAAYLAHAGELKSAILKSGRAKNWFSRAFTDNGKILGSETCEEGKIFLNPQTWAVMTGLVDPAEGRELLSRVETHLYREYGVLLFSPAYTVPDKDIGYLTRYAPGVRENGGVYTHAATWAIIAQAMAGNAQKAFETFRILCPPHLSNADPDRYSGEPYVMPGNIEGPDSLFEGRGAWTWYTGSAAWYYRAVVEFVLGVRVEDDSLVVRPCIPPEWPGFSMTRVFRGEKFSITVGQQIGESRRIQIEKVD